MPVRWYLVAKAVVDFYGCEGYESLYHTYHSRMESGRWLLAFQLNVIMALMYCSWGIYISSPVWDRALV